MGEKFIRCVSGKVLFIALDQILRNGFDGQQENRATHVAMEGASELHGNILDLRKKNF